MVSPLMCIVLVLFYGNFFLFASPPLWEGFFSPFLSFFLSFFLSSNPHITEKFLLVNDLLSNESGKNWAKMVKEN